MTTWKHKGGKHKITLPIGCLELRWVGGTWRSYFNNQNLQINGLNINELKKKAMDAVGNRILESAQIIDALEKEAENDQ
jgi:hypothetical protein